MQKHLQLGLKGTETAQSEKTPLGPQNLQPGNIRTTLLSCKHGVPL